MPDDVGRKDGEPVALPVIKDLVSSELYDQATSGRRMVAQLIVELAAAHQLMYP